MKLNATRFFWLLSVVLALPLSAEESVLEIIALSHRPAEEIVPLIRPLLAGDDKIVASGLQLIVRTNPSRLREIQKVIDELDKSPHNLLITVVQGQDIELDELEARADLSAEIPINDPAQSNVEITGRYHRTQSDNSNDYVQRVRILEGSSAFIKFGEDRPTQGYLLSNTGERIYLNEMNYLETTAGFAVVPKLVGDHVMLKIAPWAENSRGSTNVVDTQSASTTIKVRLGEWVTIGGQTAKLDSKTSGTLTKIEKTLSRSNGIFVKIDDLDAEKAPALKDKQDKARKTSTKKRITAQ